jgi:hypothetical protein
VRSEKPTLLVRHPSPQIFCELIEELWRKRKTSVGMFALGGLDFSAPHISIDSNDTALEIEVGDLQPTQLTASHSRPLGRKAQPKS